MLDIYRLKSFSFEDCFKDSLRQRFKRNVTLLFQYTWRIDRMQLYIFKNRQERANNPRPRLLNSSSIFYFETISFNRFSIDILAYKINEIAVLFLYIFLLRSIIWNFFCFFNFFYARYLSSLPSPIQR